MWPDPCNLSQCYQLCRMDTEHHGRQLVTKNNINTTVSDDARMEEQSILAVKEKSFLLSFILIVDNKNKYLLC